MPPRISRLLAHPLRDRLLFEYRGDGSTPSEVARRTGEPLNRVSYHTAMLLRHGCVELVRVERRRGAVTRVYRTTSMAVIDGDDWLNTPLATRRALMRGLAATVGERAHAAALAGGFDLEHAHLSRSPLRLDEAGAEEVAEILRQALVELARAQVRSERRGLPARPVEVVMMAFEPDREA